MANPANEDKTKTLVLVRHAKSSHDLKLLHDFDRPLNRRGYRDAPLMGRKLKDRGLTPDLIVSSTAIRAYTTAALLARQLGYPVEKIELKDSIYETAVEEYVPAIRAIDNSHQTVLLVAHNPTMTELANRLSNAAIDNLVTCGIVSMTFPVVSWHEVPDAKGKLNFYDFPKRYQADRK